MENTRIHDVQYYGQHVQGCSICQEQIEKPTNFVERKVRNLKFFKNDKIEFIKLVEYLLPPSLDLEGCELKFPDSVFFGEDGKPQFIAKTDKDGKMICVNQPNRLTTTDIRTKFSKTVTEERRNETKTIQQELAEKLQQEVASGS